MPRALSSPAKGAGRGHLRRSGWVRILVGMDIRTVIDALDAAEKSDIPTTKKDAKAITTKLTSELEKLRDFHNDLGTLLEAVETAAEELAEADGDDREGAFEQLDEDAYALRDTLKDLLKNSTQ